VKVTKPRIAVGILVLIVIGVLARERYIHVRLIRIQAKLDAIKVGISEEEVVRIMGGPGHIEAVERDIPKVDVAPTKVRQIKHSYMLLWYRPLCGSEERTFFTIDVYVDPESHKVVDIERGTWDL
jgi:hypothetical protein